MAATAECFADSVASSCTAVVVTAGAAVLSLVAVSLSDGVAESLLPNRVSASFWIAAAQLAGASSLTVGNWSPDSGGTT